MPSQQGLPNGAIGSLSDLEALYNSVVMPIRYPPGTWGIVTRTFTCTPAGSVNYCNTNSGSDGNPVIYQYPSGGSPLSAAQVCTTRYVAGYGSSTCTTTGLPVPLPTNPPLAHSSNMTTALQIAAGIGVGMLSGIALLAGAPVIAATTLMSAAVVGAGLIVASAALSNPSSAIMAANPPLQVTFQPASTQPPLPVSGGTSTPSVAVGPDGTFVPGGGALASGGSGGWTGALGSGWTYQSSGTATPIATISADGSTLGEVTPGGSVMVQKFSDATIVVNSANLPAADATGAPTTVGAAQTTVFSSTGVPSGGSSLSLSPTLGNGASTSTGTINGTGGAGTTGGTTAGTGSVTGCTSGNCATASNQVVQTNALNTIATNTGNTANSMASLSSNVASQTGFLSSIAGFFSGSGTPSADPTANTATDISGASIGSSSTFISLLGWRLPGHTSTCPTGSFNYIGRTFTFSAHCDLVNQNFGTFRAVMTAVFSLSALFIILKA